MIRLAAQSSRWLGPLLMVTSLLGHACGKRAGSPATTPASASASTGPAPAETADRSQAAPRPPPPDIDLGQLEKTIGCAGPGGKKACAVIAEFGKAGRWTTNRPSGEERWFGHSYTIEKGAERDEYVSLVSRTVPTARVGKFDLPYMISCAPLPTDFQVDAAQLWSSMSHGIRHRGSKKSPSNHYVETYTPTGERGVTNTAGASVVLITELSEDPAFIRRASMKRLLLVRPARGASADSGDGTYAEFWQATW
jgi:hypothetical protein